jgi:hypothetical protein
MTLRMWFLMFGLVVAGLCAVDAAKAATVAHPKKVSSVKKAKAKKKASKKARRTARKKTAAQNSAADELQTDVKFDDSVLHGQYQTPDEALARVENEKGLNDLLGVRKHFKDRLATASGQE